MPKSPSLPSWNVVETMAVCRALAELIIIFRARLEPRLGAAIFTEFPQRIEAFQNAVAGKPVRLSQQKSTTLDLTNAMKEGLRDAGAMRNAIKQATDDAAIHRRWGVGQKTNANTVTNVLSSLDVVIEAMQAHAHELSRFGLGPTDASALIASRQRIIDIDIEQETAKGIKRESTAGARAMQRQLIAMCRRIIGAAEVEFRAEPETLHRFRAPVPPARRSRRTTPSPRPPAE